MKVQFTNGIVRQSGSKRNKGLIVIINWYIDDRIDTVYKLAGKINEKIKEEKNKNVTLIARVNPGEEKYSLEKEKVSVFMVLLESKILSSFVIAPCDSLVDIIPTSRRLGEAFLIAS